jgi:integrase/recombinase XerD
VTTELTAVHPANTQISIPDQADSDEHLIQMWLDLRRSPNTQRAYAADVARFWQFVGRKPLRSVRLQDVLDYAQDLDDRALASATIARRLHAVRSLFAFGHEIGYMPVNVTVPVKAPSVKNTLAERILPMEAVIRIIDREEYPRNRALLRFLYASGARVSEAARLRWRDIQPRTQPDGQTAGQVNLFGKGGKTRVVLLSAATYQALNALRRTADPDEPVFESTRTGDCLSKSQIFRVVKAAAKRAGLAEPSPHWLRHAHASHALDRGAALHLVQATLGHANVATTGRYLHARPDDSSALYLPV